MTEDEQLQLALAMSVEGGQGKATKHARNGSVDMAMGSDDYDSGGGNDDDIDEEAIWAEIRRREQEEKEQAVAGAAGAAAGPSAGAAGGSSSAVQKEGTTSAPVAANDAAAVQAAARERLPAEPADREEGRCRVGLRLPDGSRPTRWFMKTDKVSVLLVSKGGGCCGAEGWEGERVREYGEGQLCREEKRSRHGYKHTCDMRSR